MHTQKTTYTSEDVRQVITRLIHHRQFMIGQKKTHHEVAQRKAITELTTMLGHTPLNDTQAIINRVWQYRYQIHALNYADSSDFAEKREEIRILLHYCSTHHTVVTLDNAKAA